MQKLMLLSLTLLFVVLSVSGAYATSTQEDLYGAEKYLLSNDRHGYEHYYDSLSHKSATKEALDKYAEPVQNFLAGIHECSLETKEDSLLSCYRNLLKNAWAPITSLRGLPFSKDFLAQLNARHKEVIKKYNVIIERKNNAIKARQEQIQNAEQLILSNDGTGFEKYYSNFPTNTPEGQRARKLLDTYARPELAFLNGYSICNKIDEDKSALACYRDLLNKWNDKPHNVPFSKQFVDFVNARHHEVINKTNVLVDRINTRAQNDYIASEHKRLQEEAREKAKEERRRRETAARERKVAEEQQRHNEAMEKADQDAQYRAAVAQCDICQERANIKDLEARRDADVQATESIPLYLRKLKAWKQAALRHERKIKADKKTWHELTGTDFDESSCKTLTLPCAPAVNELHDRLLKKAMGQ